LHNFNTGLWAYAKLTAIYQFNHYDSTTIVMNLPVRGGLKMGDLEIRVYSEVALFSPATALKDLLFYQFIPIWH